MAAVLAWFAALPLTAAPPQVSKEAKLRAASYQVQTRLVLERHHWRVVLDRSGRLVAECILGPQGPSFPGSYAEAAGIGRLSITFQPQSGTSTLCAANIVGYFRNDGGGHIHRPLVGPLPMNNPDSSKDIRDMMAEAEKRLAAQHPEFARR